MTELSAPLTEFLAQAIPQEAGLVHRSYKLVPREDLEQEMWTAALGRRIDFERLHEQGSYGVIRRRLKESSWKIVKQDDRYRRAVKAASVGYLTRDEQFYSMGVLKTLIPMWLDNGVTDQPPKGREMEVAIMANGDSDYLALMLDVDRAMRKVKVYHSNILKRYFAFPQGSGGYTHLNIAGRLGIEPEALRLRVYRALRAMQRELGGRNPWPRRGLDYSKETAA